MNDYTLYDLAIDSFGITHRELKMLKLITAACCGTGIDDPIPPLVRQATLALDATLDDEEVITGLMAQLVMDHCDALQKAINRYELTAEGYSLHNVEMLF